VAFLASSLQIAFVVASSSAVVDAFATEGFRTCFAVPCCLGPTATCYVASVGFGSVVAFCFLVETLKRFKYYKLI
jgi:hypothetical protein